MLSTILVNIFKFLCFCTTVFMVGFWIYKYQKNDDATIIEYRSLHDEVDFIYPEISICLSSMDFKNEDINVTKEENFTQRYHNHLLGIEMNETFKTLDYEILTPNLSEYIKLVTLYWENGTISSCRNIKSCPYFTFKNNFNGLLGPSITKCFGMEVEKGYVMDIQNGVNVFFADKFDLLLKQASIVQVLFNYPNQFIRPIGAVQNVWPNGTKRGELFQITSVDVVFRRNTQNNPCELSWEKYDELVMKRHLKTTRCRAPYQSRYNNISVCGTKEEMKKANKNLWTVKMDAPCYEMPYIDYKHFHADSANAGADGYVLWFNYPRKAKFVTNFKDVDVHSLLGNVGGYIGLFLGKSHLSS